MIEFNSLLAGVFALHPELNPTLWPPPLGQNPYKPPNNILRTKINDWTNPEYLYDCTTQLANRVILHKCSFGYCLDHNRFKKIKIDNSVENDNTDTSDQNVNPIQTNT